MPPAPLSPTVRDLGSLLLYRDDVQRIVDRVQSLPGVRTELEADNIKVDDLERDLPYLGDRLSYFALKAYRGTSRILSLRLAENSCTLATTDPDLEDSGVIGAIEDMARQRRRVPAWFPRISRHPVGAAARWWTAVFAILIVYLLIALFLRVGWGTSGQIQSQHPVFPASVRIATAIPVALIALFIVVGSSMSKTILLTSLRAKSAGSR